MKVRNPRELGALIRQARYERRLSQAALARLVGVQQPKISAVEGGHSGVRISLVLQIINALGLSLDIAGPEQTTDHAHIATAEELDELDALANTGLKK